MTEVGSADARPAVLGRTRWRRVSERDHDEVAARLRAWPCAPGGAVRHMFSLATLERRGPSALRVAGRDEHWAACVVLPGHLLVPAGDPATVRAAGLPTRSWRLIVGDAGSADGLLAGTVGDPAVLIHVQRFMTVEPARVPPATELSDPGLRTAVEADLDGLAELAVQLHLDDGYGPHPGRSGLRAYRRRMAGAVARGAVLCVGAVGAPRIKIERAVDSLRYGVQLAGICVTPTARAAGLGRAAVAEAVRRSLAERPGAAISLHVRADNGPALRAYVAAGFVDREEWRLAVRT